MVQVKAPVLSNRRIAPDHSLMRLEAPGIARRALPGQFIHLLCGKTTFPLLRRPFSFLDADPEAGTVDFIYKEVGLGTRVLSRVAAGSKVDLIGPLGRPFEVPGSLQAAFLVGGGVGIPPLYMLAKRLARKCQVKAFLGARTEEWVICAAEFRRLGVEVRIATDDGTLGYRGSVVDLLQETTGGAGMPRRGRIHTGRRGPPAGRPETPAVLYICGPTPMMAAAAALARREKLAAQVSLEERMGCAMGCCMGCVVEVTTEPPGSHARFQRVCTEGPVFPAEKILWKT